MRVDADVAVKCGDVIEETSVRHDQLKFRNRSAPHAGVSESLARKIDQDDPHPPRHRHEVGRKPQMCRRADGKPRNSYIPVLIPKTHFRPTYVCSFSFYFSSRMIYSSPFSCPMTAFWSIWMVDGSDAEVDSRRMEIWMVDVKVG